VEGRPRSSNHRSSLAVLLGLAGVLAVPGAVALAQQSPGVNLLDAAWAIPAGFALGLVALGLANLARTRVQWTLGRAGGLGRARAARWLAGLGIAIAVSASISVGFYEVLLRFEK
jgi:hypothetical protein